jgi:transcriptional regulator with XRE-family HTH domain
MGGTLNTALHRAMAEKRLSPRKLASRVGVSQKTVERWISDETLIPHPNSRIEAGAALGVAEDVLWPNKTKRLLKTGHDREILAVYPYRSACPSSTWTGLIRGAEKELTFAGYTNYFLWLEQPAFLATLRHKAESGCRVRFLVGEPDLEVTTQREEIEDVALTVSTRIRITLENLDKLRDAAGIESRFVHALDAPTHMSLSVFRFDREALVTPHLARAVGHDSPTMHIGRMEEGGVFDRFISHTEELWNRGRPIANT